jgi:hypothetical protein
MPRTFPLLQATGVAPHVLVPVFLEDPVSHPARDAVGAGVVEDYVVVGVERLSPFLNRANAQRSGDVLGAVFSLPQDHNELEVVPPLELLLQLFGADEIHLVPPWKRRC